MIDMILGWFFGSDTASESKSKIGSIKVGNVYEQTGGSAIVEVTDISHDGKVIHYKFLPYNSADRECVLSVTQFKSMYAQL